MKPISSSPEVASPLKAAEQETGPFRYRLHAWAFAWVPAAFFGFFYVLSLFRRGPARGGDGLVVLLLLASIAFLFYAIFQLSRLKRKNRWVFAALNAVTIFIGFFFLVLIGGYSRFYT